ncbi:MAG: anaerobic ribonucleoside-triphosphate reductase [Candidatus Woesearchaeota archaeon]
MKKRSLREVSTMDDCAVCGKELQEKEGFVSSTNVVVCSEICQEKFVQSLPNQGQSSLTVFSRVTGYYTPVSAWNKGKRQEFKDRKSYSVMEALK